MIYSLSPQIPLYWEIANRHTYPFHSGHAVQAMADVAFGNAGCEKSMLDINATGKDITSKYYKYPSIMLVTCQQ